MRLAAPAAPAPTPGRQAKVALRRLLYRHVPPALIERPKRGFRVPLAAWLRGPLRDWAEDLLDEAGCARGLLDPRSCADAGSAFLAGGGGLQDALWGVLMFQAWQRRTARRRPGAARTGGAARATAARC